MAEKKRSVSVSLEEATLIAKLLQTDIEGKHDSLKGNVKGLREAYARVGKWDDVVAELSAAPISMPEPPPVGSPLAQTANSAEGGDSRAAKPVAPKK